MKKGQTLAYVEQLGTFVPVEVCGPCIMLTSGQLNVCSLAIQWPNGHHFLSSTLSCIKLQCDNRFCCCLPADLVLVNT